ncbi:MAG: hypothetical protein ACTSQI_07880 [Candidatus Helarchaeota archaeon]
MQPIVPNYIIEPILWFIAVGLFFLLGVFFFRRYLRAEEEGRAFFNGTMVFFFSYVIFRTIEIIRRYFMIANFYDIEEWWYGPTYNPISDVSLSLRLAFLIVSWIGIAYFYFRIESTILQRKTYYILTIASLLKLIVNPLMYFPEIIPIQPMELINMILFIIAGFFPVFLFGFYALRNLLEKRGAFSLLTIGMFCYIIGEVGSNPEAWTITRGMNPAIVHYGSPIMVILGGLLLYLALKQLYRIAE